MPFTQEYSSQYHVFEFLWDSSGKNRRFSELKVLTFVFLGIYYLRRTIRKIFLMDVKGKMDDRWLSMEEICQYLGVTDDTVHNWIRKKNMPAVRLGRCWKFKKRSG